MQSIRFQFFLSFAVMGSLLPFLSVFLAERGLSQPQIGYVIGWASAAILITPVLVTMLADTRIDARRLMAAAFLLSGAMLLAMYAATGFWPILILFVLHNLAFIPTMPLQDGIHFAVQRKRSADGSAATPYHRVRVWGTVGFIIPSIVLFFFLRWEFSTSIILIAAAAMCGLGALNTLWLPDPRIRMMPQPEEALPAETRLPTLAAARAMLEPHVLVFCLGMALVHMAAAAYYGFYPLYLTETIGIGRQWIGLISSIGVTIEIFFMLGFGWLLHRLGYKSLMAIGIAAMATRLAMLALWPVAGVAIGVQALHGLTVLVLHVAPPIFLNARAGDAYRNSMQGLYTVAVMGVFRIIGGLIAGHIAAIGHTILFAYAAALCLAAAGLFVFAFHDHHRRRPDRQDDIHAADATAPAPRDAADPSAR